MKSKKFLTLVIFLTLVLFSSCSNVSSTDESLNGKKINVLCLFQDLYCKVQTEEFKKLTGIEANYTRQTTYEGVLSNLDKNDVIYGGAVNFYYLNFLNKLYPYTSKYSKPIDKKYKDKAGRWTAVDFAPVGFCSNRQTLQKNGLMPPTTWDDLLDKNYKGLVSYLDPYINAVGFNTVFSYSTDVKNSKQEVYEYFKQLDKLVPQYYTYGSLIENAVSNGELATGVMLSHDCLQSEYLSYPVTLTFPTEGTSYSLEAIAIIKSDNTEKINLSKKFVDYTLDSYSQSLSQKIGTFQLPINPTVPLDNAEKRVAKTRLFDDTSYLDIPRKHAINFIDKIGINYYKKDKKEM